MTRNRDDFSALQALRTGILGCVVLMMAMVALGSVMSGHKAAATERATVIAASALQFSAPATDVAQAATTTQRG